MPASFSYSFIPGGIKRSKRVQPSALPSAALSKPLAPVQLKMYRDEPDRRHIPFGHLYNGHGGSCCPIHESQHTDRHEEEGTPQNKHTTPHLPRPPRPYRAFMTERTNFPPVSYSDTGRLHGGSPTRTHVRVLDVNRQPHNLHKGRAVYPDEITGKRFGHLPASPGLQSVRSDVTPTRTSSFDSAVSEDRQFHAFNVSNMAPMEFKAAADKLFSVLRKAEKFLDTFLRSFKEETAAAYMDRTSEWKRKVDRYNTDLVLPNLKVDNPNGSYRGGDETPSTTDRDTFDELQAQIQKHVQQLCWSRSEKPAPCRHHHVNHDRQPGTEHDLRLPDDASIKLEVQYEVAQALLRSVETVQPQLTRYVKRMDQDYIAAWEALSMIKKLRRVLDQYRRGWQDVEENQPED